MPKGATKAAPAPGIVAMHGFLNSREPRTALPSNLPDGLCRPGARLIGHGYSEPALSTGSFFGSGIGGKAAWNICAPWILSIKTTSAWRDIPLVLRIDNYSYGKPNGYRSIVVEVGPPKRFAHRNPTFPRNMLVVFDKYDEFSKLNWEPIAADAPKGTR